MNRKLQIVTTAVVALFVLTVTIGFTLWMQSRGSQPVAPTAPESQPSADETGNACVIGFTVEPAVCNEYCLTDDSCEDGLVCDETTDTCRNPENLTSETCEGPVYSCGSSCETDSQCQAANPDYSCVDVGTGSECRLTENPESETCEPEEVIVEAICNENCGGNVVCADGLVCDDDSGTCRNPDNMTSETCEEPEYACGSSCQTDSQCQETNPDYSCVEVGFGSECRLTENPESETCSPIGGVDPSPSPSPSPSPTASTTPTTSSSPTPTPTPTETHLECVDEACTEVPGGGEDLCNSDADCRPDTYLTCVDESCVEQTGDGENTCSTDAQCQKTSHLTCVNNSCTQVEGPGADTCDSNADCQPDLPEELPETGATLLNISAVVMGSIFVILGFALLAK